MPERYNLSWVAQEVERFGRSQRIAFAAFWAQRLYPAYVAFCEAGGPGNPARLQRCLDTAWLAAEGQRVDVIDLDECQHELIHLAPEIDSGVLAYAAMEAAAAGWDCLETARTGSVSSAIRAAQALASVLDIYQARRDATAMPLDAYAEVAALPEDAELRQVYRAPLEWLLSALPRAGTLDEAWVESIRGRSTDTTVDALVDALIEAPRS
jgi:uncharacterized protein YjaG (DUF416 family)